MSQIQNILASSSPRRKTLLKQIGLVFSVEKSTIIEDYNLKISPSQLAIFWAREKARSISVNNANSIVIGADTIVNYDNHVFGKPKNKNESMKMLRFLSGKTHQVITGVSINYKKLDIEHIFHSETQVTFRNYNEEEIIEYIKVETPFDKAGSYGIQDSFAKHVKCINGCYYNVVGFPLSSFFYHFKNLHEKIKEYNGC